MHRPISYTGYIGDASYTRGDTAGYVVVIHAYAEHTTTTAVTVRSYTPATGLSGSPSNSVETATAPSVVVYVVDRKTKATVACRDFSQPERWVDYGFGVVHCEKLADADAWLDGLGLHECKWLRRSGSG